MMNKSKGLGIVLISLAFFAISMITNASAGLVFDNNCPVSSASNVNFSNGTAISLPFTYTETSMASSNLAIFLGANTDYFCSQIDDDLSTFAASRKVIFTPEFLNALKTSSCSAAFEVYMDNYRKSGDILNSTGTVFCGVKNLTFDSTAIPSGVTFDYPVVGAGVIGVNNVHYNAVQLKKYMIAYLMNNPNAELSGVISTFANAINLNVSLSCPDTTSITNFFNSGKGNYTANFKPKLRGVDYGSGESLSPSNGISGAFGWLLDFALGDQTLPIITAANLSTNKIYVCGINSIEEYYSNSTITTSGKVVNLTITSEINASLEIKTDSDVSGATIEVFKYTDNPKADGALSVAELGKYLGIKIDSELEKVISSAIIKVYYTHAEVSAARADENTLRLYYYDAESGDWVKYDSPNGGVNTIENYVWANTTHFSDWGVFGTALSSSGSGGHGGAEVIVTNESTCTVIWSCIEWSQCINGIQTRFCNNAGTCNLNPVKETRSCIITPIIPVTIPTSAAKTAPSAPTITGAATLPTKPTVPLQTLWFSLIAALLIIGMISWTILKKRNSDREGLREKIKETRKIIRGAKREIKRVRKQEKKAERRKRRK
jgi:hypothetical protein